MSVEGPNIEVVSVDFATGQMAGGAGKLIADDVGANTQPEWSPDGKFVFYVSQSIAARLRRPILRIRELGTGMVREITPQLSVIWDKTWSPDGKFYAVGGADLLERNGLFLVNAETGELSLLAPRAGFATWSPDGQWIAFVSNRTPERCTRTRSQPHCASFWVLTTANTI